MFDIEEEEEEESWSSNDNQETVSSAFDDYDRKHNWFVRVFKRMHQP